LSLVCCSMFCSLGTLVQLLCTHFRQPWKRTEQLEPAIEEGRGNGLIVVKLYILKKRPAVEAIKYWVGLFPPLHLRDYYCLFISMEWSSESPIPGS
jgi:hypothetical protein